MIEINTDIKNIKKLSFRYLTWFYRNFMHRDKSKDPIDQAYNCIRWLKNCNNFERLVSLIMDQTNTRNKDYIMDTIKGWAFVDTNTRFSMKTDEKAIYEYKFVISAQNNCKPSMTRDKLLRLNEMYEIVKEFTERDYNTEDDIGFYFEELEPSVKVGQTIEIDYLKIKKDYWRLHKPEVLKQEAIDYMLISANIDTQIYYIRKGLLEELKINILGDSISL